MRHAWLLAVWLLLASSAVLAHEVRPALLTLTEGPGGAWTADWKQPLAGDRYLPLAPVFDLPCDGLSSSVPERRGAALVTRFRLPCAPDAVRIEGLDRSITDALVRWQPLDAPLQTWLLRPGDAALDLRSPEPPPVSGYLVLGVEHLLGGIDHLLFVFGLVLLVPGLKRLAITVTAFTLAHSITLGVSALGLFSLPSRPVEACIALSLVLLAMELAARRGDSGPPRRPWLLAFVFGLLHGFGFAGALAEIGLPQDAVAPALLLFNVGIELGQLAAVAVLLGLWALVAPVLRRWPVERLRAVAVVVLGSTATWWTLERVAAFGG